MCRVSGVEARLLLLGFQLFSQSPHSGHEAQVGPVSLSSFGGASPLGGLEPWQAAARAAGPGKPGGPNWSRVSWPWVIWWLATP